MAGCAGAAESVAREKEGEWRQLFNGRDLSGWETYLAKPDKTVTFRGESRDAKGEHRSALGHANDPTGVFTVVQLDGRNVVRISGEIFGTLTTLEEFENYHVRLVMRWGKKKWAPREERVRDSGILYHAFGPQSPTRAWLSSFELQIQEKDFGDFYAVGTRAAIRSRRVDDKLSIYDPAGELQIFGPGAPRRCIRLRDTERPHGDWNVVEVICEGDRSWHIVNGEVVMRLERLEIPDGDVWRKASSGRIQLQSEGAEWFLAKIEIRALRPDEDPEETANARGSSTERR